MSSFSKAVIAFCALAGAGFLLGHASEADAAEAVCTGQAPANGVLRGPVLHVESGDTLCVALGATPDRWVKLTLADAPQAGGVQRASITAAGDNPRGTLMAVAFSQNVDCTVQDAGRAVCTLPDGRSIGPLLRQPAAWAAGKEWR
ncbi:MAG TPA: hypothetical protein VEA44_06100 [Caulobacter sp.]|nr:hypothetical protein [Caulobacter sp.]